MSTQETRAQRETRIMREERDTLRVAFAKCVELAEESGADPGKLWLMWLRQRTDDLECQQAGVYDWMARAIVAVKVDKP